MQPQLKQETAHTPEKHGFDQLAKRLAISLAVLASVSQFGVLSFFTYVSSDPSRQWLRDIVIQHPAATIGTPLRAVMATCIILLFRASSGPIEFEFLTVKFKGGSGPAVIWILTFLAISYSMKLLWNP
jgi:hypothetical protein